MSTTATALTPISQPQSFERPRAIVQRTGMSKSAVYDVLKSGRVPTKRVGRIVLVPVGAFDQFMDSETERHRA